MQWMKDLAYKLRTEKKYQHESWKRELSSQSPAQRAKVFFYMWNEVDKLIANETSSAPDPQYPAILGFSCFEVESGKGTSSLWMRASNGFGMQINSRPFFDGDTVAEYGKKFCVFRNPWLSMADFYARCIQLDVDNRAIDRSLRSLETAGYWLAPDGVSARLAVVDRSPAYMIEQAKLVYGGYTPPNDQLQAVATSTTPTVTAGSALGGSAFILALVAGIFFILNQD